jgi:hypothetical protein
VDIHYSDNTFRTSYTDSKGNHQERISSNFSEARAQANDYIDKHVNNTRSDVYKANTNGENIGKIYNNNQARINDLKSGNIDVHTQREISKLEAKNAGILNNIESKQNPTGPNITQNAVNSKNSSDGRRAYTDSFYKTTGLNPDSSGRGQSPSSTAGGTFEGGNAGVGSAK